MRIAIINMIPYGSTGKIMLQLADTARKNNCDAKTYSTVPFDKKDKKAVIDLKDHYEWGSMSENRLHYYLGTLLGRNGCYSHKGTRQMIRDLKRFDPDVIHLHNLHKFCINLPMLFKYLKQSEAKVIWTLHDCWSFTGQCPHFIMAKCDKWRSGCHHCPQITSYPKSRIDNSKNMYRLKRKWFTGVPNMTIVTPSKWLAELVSESYLKEYPIRVINNGIDLSVFKPTAGDFKARYNCENKKILLGVSFGWGVKKGLDVFLELAKRLDNEYQIVLVGTNAELDAHLPQNIISIHRTHDQRELAEIYTAADLFVNPTREEVLGLVNIEALACGTPVLTFQTGGCPEIVDATCGSVVNVDDVDAMEREIIRICTDSPYSAQACIEKAKYFNMYDRYAEYIELYREVADR